MSTWFAKKLAGETTPTTAPTPPVPPPPPESLTDALRDPAFRRGGEASRTENSRCPSCASTNYFSRSNANATPRCYDCGHPIHQRGTGL